MPNKSLSHLTVLVEILEQQLTAGKRMLEQSLTDEYLSTMYNKGYIAATEEALRIAKTALADASK
jgi:hypothetical protein